MDSEKRENPRSLLAAARSGGGGGGGGGSGGGGVMANDKPSPQILERFKALMKQRDDEVRVTAGDDDGVVSLPSSEEIVQLYEILLAELIFNSKPVITDLTIIAGEQKEHGKGIAEAICSRIIEVRFGVCGNFWGGVEFLYWL